MTNEMTEEMKAARRAYDRAYYASHKEEAAERKRRYWLRKAEKMAAEKAAEGTGKNEATDEHELLKKQPEIVRCKYCKHREPEDHKCDCGHDIMWQLPRADDWFCADGERR